MDMQIRSADSSPPPRAKRVARVPRMRLAPRQRDVLDVIVQYYRGTEEPCPARHVARRLNISHVTVYAHLQALHDKGWLVTASAPSVPTVF